eukprot:g2241.t1
MAQNSITPPPAPSYRLVYFRVPALGEPVRLMLHLNNFQFKDEKISYAELKELKPDLPYGSVPVLVLPTGEKLAQMRAITRFLGKSCVIDGKKMYPDDPMEAFKADEIMDACMDVQGKMAKTFSMQGEERVKARKTLFHRQDGLCYEITSKLERRVKMHNKKYSSSDFLTVGDVVLFTWLNSMRCGFLDDIPADYLNDFPELKKRVETIAKHPRVMSYYSKKNEEMYNCFQA